MRNQRTSKALISGVYISQGLITLILVASFGWMIRQGFREHSLSLLDERIRNVLELVRIATPPNPTTKWCQEYFPFKQLRLTIIDRMTSTRICDSHYGDIQSPDPSKSLMAQPELKEATQVGYGTSLRLSNHSGILTYYTALDDPSLGVILRVSLPTTEVESGLREFDIKLGLLLLFLFFGLWGGLHLSQQRSIRKLSQALNFSELRQGTLLDAITEPVGYLNSDQQLVFCNGAYALAFGSEPPERMDGSQLVQRVKSRERDRTYLLKCTPVRDSQSSERGTLLVFQNITAFEVAETRQTQFIGDVSHELKTPLTAIRGFAETIMQDLSQGIHVEPELARQIVISADRLQNLTQQLLSLTKLQEEDGTLHMEWLDVLPLTEEVLLGLQPLLKSRTQEVRIDAQVKQVFANRHLLEQVLINLIENATHYGASPVGILIHWTPDPHEKGVLLQVQDFGPGIPPDQLPRVFDRFFRAEPARDRTRGGSGLGLAIVREAVKRQGGRVWVESKLGQGSSFFCSFGTDGFEKQKKAG